LEPWLLLTLQVAIFASFPFAFVPLPPDRRQLAFTLYIAAVLMVAGTLGVAYALPVPGGGRISLGGIAYGAVIMSTMMLYVVTHRLDAVRIAIRLVVVLNVLIAVLLAVTAAALRSPEVINPFDTSPELFSAPIWSAVVGGVLNVGQLVLLIVIFEATKRRVTNVPLLGTVHVAAFVVVLGLDGLLFPTLVTAVEPGLTAALGSGIDGLRSKLVVGLFYTLPLIAFLTLHRDHLRTHRDVPLDLRDAFLSPRAELTAELERQEEAVERQAALLRLAGRLGRVGGWAVDVSSGQLYWSDEVFDILEVPRDRQPTLPEALAAWPVEHRETVQEALRACTEQGVSFDLEAETVTGTGRRLWVRAVGAAERDGDGQISRVVGAFLDITPAKEAAARTEALAQRLTTTMESITDAIGTIDRSWRITYLNPRAEQLLGADLEEVLGQPLAELYPEGLGSDFDHAYRRAMYDGTTEVAVDFFEPAQRWIEANAYPSDDGLTVYFRDVTERVGRERTLEQIVEREQEAADQLRHLNQVKDSFLTAVSHELRTPLTVIQGMARTLQRLRGDADPALRTRVEDALADNAERLGHLLTDLLDVDRLSRGVLTAKPQRFDLIVLATEIVASSRVAGRTTIEAPDELEVLADPVRTERILVNLLDNAAKYAPDGTVTLRLMGLGEHGAHLEIRDEGPGIPDRELTSVFEPFHRIDHDHPQPGTGVGLALVAEFAAIHGGRAWAEPTGGRGAHLIVELPGEPGEPPAG
jgi:PAS domain S-box-containing protein